MELPAVSKTTVPKRDGFHLSYKHADVRRREDGVNFQFPRGREGGEEISPKAVTLTSPSVKGRGGGLFLLLFPDSVGRGEKGEEGRLEY